MEAESFFLQSLATTKAKLSYCLKQSFISMIFFLSQENPDKNCLCKHKPSFYICKVIINPINHLHTSIFNLFIKLLFSCCNWTKHLVQSVNLTKNFAEPFLKIKDRFWQNGINWRIFLISLLFAFRKKTPSAPKEKQPNSDEDYVVKYRQIMVLFLEGKKKQKKNEYNDIFIPINFLTTNTLFDHC